MTTVPTTSALLVAVGVLAAGTYALRLAGAVAASRTPASPRVEAVTAAAVAVVLLALVATSTLTDAGRWLDPRHPAELARPAGVLVAGVLVHRRASVVVVVVAAAVTTALWRALVPG